jgi:outer membrane protein OmpA-like peptidoglycan-associated protein
VERCVHRKNGSQNHLFGFSSPTEKETLMTRFFATGLITLLSLEALAQAEPQSASSVPVYRVTVVARTIKAINYRHRSGSTRVEFRGTSLMPDARGTGDVQSKQGAIHVDAGLKHLQPASKFGPEYLTYVLWAISPEGRPVNLGEVVLNESGNSKLNVTSDLQSFGLIVTAEPYFAVTRPSDVVVMENFASSRTNGTIEDVDAKFELLQRGQYTLNVAPSELQPMALDPNVPLEVYEARNAVRIAKWAAAEQHASDSLQKAELDLRNAESLLASKGDRKALITDAREAAQMAEDARVISVRKIQEEQRAEQARVASEARAQAQQASSQAEVARSQAEEARSQAEEAKQQQAQAEAGKEAALAEQRQAQAEAENARVEAERAQQQAQRAEQEKTELRTKLLRQLNDILQTRDTLRGLVVNMSDVLFDSGKYTLKSAAREKLAKVAGVLMAYPGLTVEVDGYTDNLGREQPNQILSEKRAEGVRDYLLQQGVAPGSLTARGFGEANPVASNDTSIGRQLNRRVELVLSGEVIGAAVSPSAASPQHSGDRVARINDSRPSRSE